MTIEPDNPTLWSKGVRGPCQERKAKLSPVSRLLYLAGRGDAIGSYQRALAGGDARGELAIPYSTRLFRACRRLDVGVHALVANDGHRVLVDGNIRIQEYSPPLARCGGLRYHLGQILHGLLVLREARRHRSQIAVVATAGHWFVLAPLSWMGIRIVPSLHNTLWPRGRRPNDFKSRVIQKINAWFWRKHVHATIAVSDECARQVEELCGGITGPIHVVVAQYPSNLPPTVDPPRRRPFRLVFVGRVEDDKGIWDILEASDRLEASRPGEFIWSFAGDGSALSRLRSEAESRNRPSELRVLGRLSPDRLLAEIDASHVVLSPTTSSFCEGLQKVAVEGILRRRPVITTVFSNAFDRFGKGLLECKERNSQSIIDACIQIADDEVRYQAMVAEAESLSRMLTDRSLCYETVVAEMISPSDTRVKRQ